MTRGDKITSPVLNNIGSNRSHRINHSVSLSIYYQNVRGLRTKTNEFYMGVVSEDYDLLVITETWLLKGIGDSEIFDDRYSIFRADRDNDKTRGGGVLVAVKKKFAVEVMETDTGNSYDIEWLLIRVKVRKNFFYLCVVYVPPRLGLESYARFFDVFDRILGDNAEVLIVGDFNVPKFETGDDCEKSILINAFLSVNNLVQCNTVFNYMQRKLDLVLSNMRVCDVGVVDSPLVREDVYHPALQMSVYIAFMNTAESHSIRPSHRYDYARGDFLLLYRLLVSINWIDLEGCVDVDSCVEIFYAKLYECIEQAVPRGVAGKGLGGRRKYPVFFSWDLIKKIKLKNRLHGQVSRGTAGRGVVDKFRALRSSIKAQTTQESRVYHENLENNIRLDPSSFWSFLRTRKQRNSVPSEVDFGGQSYDDPQAIANAFAQYFSSVYQTSTASNLANCWGNFRFSEITEGQVMNSIKKLKPKKATGSDSIPAYIYKGCAELFSAPLALIFNLAIKNGVFPGRLKEAIVSPVFKSGNVRSVENYRPISVLNSVAKVFENLLYDNLLRAFQNEFVHNQHGFLPGRSTVSNLCILTDAAARAINNKAQLDVIMTDCARAFDKVDHGILVDRLSGLGLSGGACMFVKSYLSNRSQQVKVGRGLSERYAAVSGVPQGSNLGPLLFAFFINTLPASARFSDSLLFADDFKILKYVSTPEDCQQLQSDLNSVTEWLGDNRMPLNVDKCQVITFTRKVNCVDYNYTIDNSILQRKNECCDLGVHLQTNLKFNKHYNSMVNKAYRALGFIIRNAGSFKKIDSIIILYNAWVRPHLEYASVIWAPQAEQNKNMIEKVQKKFLRYLYVRQHHAYPYLVSYRSLLNVFHFVPLVQRRNMNSVLFIYNVINNLKFKDSYLINRIKFKVPKVHLRIINKMLFYYNSDSCSPLNNMVRECNLFISDWDVDLFNTTVQEIRLCFDATNL